MQGPLVSFVVPCYKLAHLLSECINSILDQTYRNFEVLIMDDCSPDNTLEVAQSFRDSRVKHIRNEPNLGHLRNYNKGIGLAAGKYVWLISADDRLRKPYVLEQYVQVMEAWPEVGYAFCCGIGLQDGREEGIVNWATLNQPDRVIDGREFLFRLLESNCVLAPSAMVRMECYKKVSVFPLDLPFAGDWYLWCVFALSYDVAYFSEPMVYYRQHGQSMTDSLVAEQRHLLSQDDLAVRWRMKEKAERAGNGLLVEHCMSVIVEDYIKNLTKKKWRGTKYRMSRQEFEFSLARHARNEQQRDAIRRRVLAGVGARLYWDDDFEVDLQIYKLAVEYGPRNRKLWLKYAILRLGPIGLLSMRALSHMRALTRRPHTRSG